MPKKFNFWICIFLPFVYINTFWRYIISNVQPSQLFRSSSIEMCIWCVQISVVYLLNAWWNAHINNGDRKRINDINNSGWSGHMRMIPGRWSSSRPYSAQSQILDFIEAAASPLDSSRGTNTYNYTDDIIYLLVECEFVFSNGSVLRFVQSKGFARLYIGYFS